MAAPFPLLLALLASSAAAAPAADEAPIACAHCGEWNAPHTPFRLFGDSWYVGTAGLSSVLIDSGDGLILLDGDLPQSAQGIAAHVRALGHDVHEIRWIVASHGHFDHVGGIAALQRLSGARVAASAKTAQALRAGAPVPEDPQAADASRFPPIPAVVPIADGGTIALGHVVLTAHATPGHTPGATSWSWRSCEGARCVNVVYADSVTAISSDGFRYDADPARVAAFRKGLDTLEGLPCDLMVTTHPGASHLFERLAAREAGNADALLDANACRAYAEGGHRGLDARLQAEASNASAAAGR
jgi:metallo-beta-lactamase class B